MKRRRAFRMLAALCATSLVVVAAGDGAGAAEPADDKPPVLWIVKTPAFLDGSTVNGVGYSTDPVLYYTSMSVELQWGAKDPSGICGYSLFAVPTGAAPYALFENEMLTSFEVSADEYDGDFGGGSTLTDGWKVVATDCAGNTSESTLIANRPTSVQDRGTSPNAAPGTVEYEGVWFVDKCQCWSDGTTRKTWRPDASVTYTAEFLRGEHVGLVMAVGPDRGAVRVLVDGEPRSRVDTYSPTPGFRRVVWETWMSEGEHRITVVNLSTEGRHRIDVDAFLHSKRVLPAD